MTRAEIAKNIDKSHNGLAKYTARLLGTFLRNLAEFLWQQIIVGFVLACAILWQQARRGLISTSAIKGNALSILAPYVYVLIAALVWHLARAAYLLDREDQEEIERLRRDVEHLRPKPDEREASSAKALEELERLINSKDEGLTASDPRIAVEVETSSLKGLAPATSIAIRNTGGSEVQKLRLKPFQVAGKLVRFEDNISAIVAGGMSNAIFPIVEGVGPLQRHNLPLQMSKDWDNQGGDKTERLVFAAEAAYEDYKGLTYCAEWNYEFYPIKYRMKLGRDSKTSFRPDTSGPFLTVSRVRTRKLLAAPGTALITNRTP
jgi:hypothetical protein